MLAATHIIAAGYVGEKIGNPFLALLAGVFVHFLLDSIPHYDTTDGGKFTKRQSALIILDIIVGFLVIFFILKVDFSIKNPFLWGAFGGILPDVLDVLPPWNKAFQRTKFGKKFHKLHDYIQKIRLTPVPGLFVQIILIIIFSYLYINH